MSQGNDIKISFIIPVYNARQYLKKCIDSILDIQGISFEIILVNDGSSDNSGDICNEYLKKDKRVIVINQENQGTASARNTGINNSSGNYLFFVDNDDFVNGDILKKIIPVLNDGVDIVINRYYIINNDQNISIGNDNIKESKVNHKEQAEVLSYFQRNRINIMPPWEYVVKREIIINNNLNFNADQAGVDDSVFTPILFSYCQSFWITKEPVYYWRNRRGSQSKNYNISVYISKIILTINSLNRFLNNLSDKYKINYISFCTYKNIYALFGAYIKSAEVDKKTIRDWYYNNKNLVKKSARQSGIFHRALNIVFGNFYGPIISYKLAQVKGRCVLLKSKIKRSKVYGAN